MDIADDISYAIHDLEDFVGSNLIRLEDYMHEFATGPLETVSSFYSKVGTKLGARYPYYDSIEMSRAAKWFEQWIQITHTHVRAGRLEASIEGALSERVSTLLDDFIAAVEVHPEPAWDNGPYVVLRKDVWHRVHLLKQFTMTYVVRSPAIAAQQRSANRLVRDLTSDLLDWARGDTERLPLPIRTRLKPRPGEGNEPNLVPKTDSESQRLVLDFVSGLTDHGARSLYARLNPSSSSRLLDSDFV